ncbi:hypothetical protein BH10BAC6_BH10BAC6_02580 [soil metagenome]
MHFSWRDVINVMIDSFAFSILILGGNTMFRQYRTLWLLFVLLGTTATAQVPFPTLWKSSFDVSPDKQKRFNSSATLVFGANEDGACMLRGTDGKPAWSYSFKDKFGVGSFEYETWNEGAGIILFMEDADDASIKVFVDDKTGTELWRTNRLVRYGEYSLDNMLRSNLVSGISAMPVFNGKDVEFVDARTGKVMWTNTEHAAYDDDGFDVQSMTDYSLIMVTSKAGRQYIDLKSGHTVESKKIGAFRNMAAASNTVIESKELKMRFGLDLGSRGLFSIERSITVTATDITSNEQVWSISFDGKVMEDLMSLGIIGEGATPNTSMRLVNDKLLVQYEGVTCFDARTGHKLWSTEYQSSDYSGGLKIEQTLHTAAILVSENSMYLVDRDAKKIHKFDIATGTDSWSATSINSDDIVPTFVRQDNIVLAQFGGRLAHQTYFTGSQEYKYNHTFSGDSYGVRAYNAANGAIVWDTEKMEDVLKSSVGDRMTNLFVHGQHAYFCGDKMLYVLDVQTGKPKYTVDITSFELGKPWALSISEDGNRLFADCDKGVLGLMTSDGSKVFATNTKKNLGRFANGANSFVWTGDEDVELKSFVGLDLTTGAIKGSFESDDAMTASEPPMSKNGEYVVGFDDKNVVLYKVNK